MEKTKKRTFLLIAGSEATRETLAEQIFENFGDAVSFCSVAMDSAGVYPDGGELPAADYYIISSEQMENELEEAGALEDGIPRLVCERSLSFHNIEKVIHIPAKERVLFVNDAKQTAESCVRDLLELGINHVEYTAWYPGVELPPAEAGGYRTAVTAGECQLVPEGTEEIIDLGPRIIDILSLLKIAELAGIREYDRNKIIKPYTRKIIEISREMALVNARSKELMNTLAEKLTSRGHVALYTFSDILGQSGAMKDARERAAKLARTDLTVLIEGESGTGKELFASAIHNSSFRSHGPFLAVNFSALPEELVESELFGYVGGAFTGASRGGKTGLFEKADHGTIFLDEIGDISPKMQTRLLRVLQEKEVMPVGSSTIKKVDIRIVAATNKDLKEMVASGRFRADLYYRLKMGYLYLPPLRERMEDIRELVRRFIENEAETPVNVSEGVFRVFLEYDWIGNVREVSNTVKYMLAVRDDPGRITERDLPDERYFGGGERRQSEEPETEKWEAEMDGTETEEILLAVWRLRRTMGFAGRAAIAEQLAKQGLRLTEAQVRGRLSAMERRGLVKSFRGKKGTVLTAAGQKVIESGISNQPI